MSFNFITQKCLKCGNSSFWNTSYEHFHTNRGLQNRNFTHPHYFLLCHITLRFEDLYCLHRRCQWQRRLRHWPAAAPLLGLQVRIPQGAWMSVCCEFCLLCEVEVSTSSWSLVQRSPIECGVSECDREASTTRSSWPARGYCTMENNIAHIFRAKVKKE